MKRCESVRIASILHACALPFSITFAMCAFQEHYFEVSTPMYVYWSAIGNTSSPHLHVKVTEIILSSLHATTTTAHVLTVAGTLHFLVYSSLAPSLFVFAILRVFLIFPRNHPQTSIPTPYPPPPCDSLLCCFNCYYHVINIYSEKNW